MKRKNFLFPGLCLFFVFLLFHCHRASSGVVLGSADPPAVLPDQAQPLKEGTAEPPQFAPGRFEEILVADFEDKDPSPDFLLGEEIAAYLVWEIRPRFKGKVSRWAGDVPAAEHQNAALLTGSASLSRQLRKALRRGDIPVDGPFRRAGRGLIEQGFYTLTVSVTGTVAATGEILFTKDYEESRAYEDIGKPPDFALYELMDRIKADLFPVLFGPPARAP